jgi:hypothetical protein
MRVCRRPFRIFCHCRIAVILVYLTPYTFDISISKNVVSVTISVTLAIIVGRSCVWEIAFEPLDIDYGTNVLFHT